MIYVDDDKPENAIRNAFQEYEESEDYKESIYIDKAFNDPEGDCKTAIWCAFIAGWEARERSINERIRQSIQKQDENE